MGLITCAKCGKVYDYEKYNGICPKCARYNREATAAEEHQEYHNKYDGGYSHTEEEHHYSYHQRYDETRNPHKHQLAGVQETLWEVMGAEHKVTVEQRKGKGNPKAAKDKNAWAIFGVLVFIFIFNVIPFAGILLVPAILGVVIYLLCKKKK